MMLPFVLLWLGLVVAAFAAAIVVLLRRGASGALHALALTLGVTMTAGFLSAGIGWFEGVATPIGTTVAIAVGMTGVALLVVGARGVRRPPTPGTCRRCGYDRRGLDADAPCPECGARAAA